MSTAETHHRGGIVAGFDGSDQARRAVWWAAGEAVLRGCPLQVVQAEAMPLATVGHAWGPMAAPGWEPGIASGWDPVTLLGDDRVRRHTEEVLTALADEIRAAAPEMAVSDTVEDGRPAAVLTAAAQRAEAELLVLGATGLGALPRMLLGSTAAELVHNTELPVTVVRDTQSEQATDDAPVVLGLDGTQASHQAVGFAFDFAARHRCPLHAVHAQSDRPLDVLAAAGLWDRASDRDVARDEIADKLLGERRQRHPQVPVRLDIVDDRPARALMERSEHARLLVVGNRGRGAVSRVLLGSVSHAAMYHASCPVVVVPAADDAS